MLEQESLRAIDPLTRPAKGKAIQTPIKLKLILDMILSSVSLQFSFPVMPQCSKSSCHVCFINISITYSGKYKHIKILAHFYCYEPERGCNKTAVTPSFDCKLILLGCADSGTAQQIMEIVDASRQMG